jgi:hypothetical protein
MSGVLVSQGRAYQVMLIGCTLLGSWLAMQAVHELGHVLGAWLTGGRVERVVLHPLTVSRTDLSYNPRPLVVAWAGPVVGSAAPLVIWAAALLGRLPGAFVLRFFAGVCLVANGLYLGVGSFNRIGDGGDLLRQGAALWQLWLFGAMTTPLGVLLWHRQGEHFGLGKAQGQVDRRVAWASLAACLLLLILGWIIGA